MSTRHLFSLILALVCSSSIGCCGYMGGCGRGMGGQMYGGPSCGCPSCGCPEASCCCPEPACGCCDACTGPSCGCCDACCEPACGCDDCCEPSCGCDVGCGTPVGYYPILGNCCIIQRLRQAFWGCSSGYGGCSSEPYWDEWQSNPPCNCQGGGQASTGGHYGGAYGRRAYMAKQHQNISEELRFADQGLETTYK